MVTSKSARTTETEPATSESYIPKGYKQAEIGVIPEDWEVYTIGDSMRLVNGRAFKPQDWKERGLPIIRIQNLNDPESAFNYYSGSIEDRHRVEAGDLLFAWSGTTGTSFGARIWKGPTGVLNQHIFKVIPDQKKVTLGYALLVLRKVQEHIEKQAHGFKASFVHVKKSDLVSVQLPLPPTKTEQETIAAALSDVDALIESLEQLITKKRLIKQGVLQELLTCKKRLLGFTGEWKIKRLGALGSTFGGLTGKSRDDFGHGSSHYITFMNIITNVVINCAAFDSVDVRPTEIQNRVAKGDLFFNGSSETPEEVGMCAVLADKVQDVFLNSFCFGFRFHEGAPVDGLYLAYYFRSRQGRELLKSLAQGATRYNLSKTAFMKVSFPLPQAAEQTAIAAVLSEIDAEIAALEVKLAKARMIKQGMMQQLLSGRIRLV